MNRYLFAIFKGERAANRMMSVHKDWFHVRVKSGVLSILCLLSPLHSHAFQSVKIQTLRMGASIGIPRSPFKIRHTPLASVSPVTRKVIILGETGSEVPPVPPPYEQRLTSFSDFGPIENRKIRMRVVYRYVPSLDPNVVNTIPLSELPRIEGTDPVYYAFEVPQSSATTGFLQYRIIAEQLFYSNGNQIVTARRTFPETTISDPNPFVNVGVQANAREVIGPDGGSIILTDGNPVDGETKAQFPAQLFQTPTAVSLDEIPLSSIEGLEGPSAKVVIPGGLNNPVAVYVMDSEAAVRGLFQVTFLYQDFTYPQGRDGTVDGTNILAKNLSILGWDGFAWRKLGGTINTKNNTVTIKSGFYKFFAIAPAGPISPEDARPFEKIITPNGDNINDAANFVFGSFTDTIKVEIFDMSGHRIRTLLSSNTQEWDGRDDSGSIVESGVYIYQYEVEGKRVSGVIAVAK